MKGPAEGLSPLYLEVELKTQTSPVTGNPCSSTGQTQYCPLPQAEGHLARPLKHSGSSDDKSIYLYIYCIICIKEYVHLSRSLFISGYNHGKNNLNRLC